MRPPGAENARSIPRLPPSMRGGPCAACHPCDRSTPCPFSVSRAISMFSFYASVAYQHIPFPPGPAVFPAGGSGPGDGTGTAPIARKPSRRGFPAGGARGQTRRAFPGAGDRGGGPGGGGEIAPAKGPPTAPFWLPRPGRGRPRQPPQRPRKRPAGAAGAGGAGKTRGLFPASGAEGAGPGFPETAP